MVERPRVVLQTDLPGAVSKRSGKVRDIYDFGEGLLMVATDRLSVFDVVLPTGIPDKGRVLTGLSVFWFNKTRSIVPNHLVSADVAHFPEPARRFERPLRGRAMWCRKAEVIPVECVVRGYLAGSGWKEYQETGKVSDHDLPPGLLKGAKLPEPIFTPTTKARAGHDEKITRAQLAEQVGKQLAERLEELSLQIYTFAEQYLRERGLILADTKFEFGFIDGELCLVDELLTPDSSRYWDAASWKPGEPPEAFDKQFARDYAESTGWNKQPPGPELPPAVVAETRRQYLEAYRRVTGQELPPA